jgi:VanZ family protein
MSKEHKFLIFSVLAVFMVTLFFGMRPKGFIFLNNVQWIPDRSGIHFGQYGIAYTKLDQILARENRQGQSDFSIEIAIEPETVDSGEFRVIFSCYGGEDSEQIIIGQWRSSIIVMNGDDYAHKKETRRLEAKMAVSASEPVFVSLTTGQNGTHLYVDGQAVNSSAAPVLLPKGDHHLLTLGNSVYGKNSWRGNMLFVSFYTHELTSEAVRSHFDEWISTKTYVGRNNDNPLLYYIFDKLNGTEASNWGQQKYPLIIPTWMHLLKKRILASPLTDFELNEASLLDVTINFIGFMPLGFCLCTIFVTFDKRNRKQAIFLATGLCFAVSLGIETTQAWIPSRSSQLLDVFFNTLGALAGAKIIFRGKIGRPPVARLENCASNLSLQRGNQDRDES